MVLGDVTIAKGFAHSVTVSEQVTGTETDRSGNLETSAESIRDANGTIEAVGTFGLANLGGKDGTLVVIFRFEGKTEFASWTERKATLISAIFACDLARPSTEPPFAGLALTEERF